MRLRIDGDTRLLVLTGAGVSAESGVPTFRDAGGLWENHPVEQVATPEGFEEDPRLVWRFYSERRRRAKTVAPNAGHAALADAESRMGDRFLLVTQNVDGLHRRAGSIRLVEIHGNLFETSCTGCRREPFSDELEYLGDPPRCEECAAQGRRGLMRPAVVWFGEVLDPMRLHRVSSFVDEACGGRLVFLAVGTSGLVYPAAGMVLQARAAGAEAWLVNTEP
ncbi:MAG TPA: Sir2 family NAD-dependent protein deacetylase, partial [Vicinamibacteria bacterium]|nr:Sir2 family NAD-dependent protein deacetylase [Vicinamibacteria bacterium]